MEEENKESHIENKESRLEEDEQLARALQESLNTESPPRHDNRNSYNPFPFFFSSGHRYMQSFVLQLFDLHCTVNN